MLDVKRVACASSVWQLHTHALLVSTHVHSKPTQTKLYAAKRTRTILYMGQVYVVCICDYICICRCVRAYESRFRDYVMMMMVAAETASVGDIVWLLAEARAPSRRFMTIICMCQHYSSVMHEAHGYWARHIILISAHSHAKCKQAGKCGCLAPNYQNLSTFVCMGLERVGLTEYLLYISSAECICMCT